MAASRDQSDESSGDESKKSTKGRTGPPSKANAVECTTASLRRGKLVTRGSTGNVHMGRNGSSTNLRRASSKSLGDEDSDQEKDGWYATPPRETFSQTVFADEQRSARNLVGDQRPAVRSLPIAFVTLPPIDIPTGLKNSNDEKLVAPAAPEIDWANFVHAYARGHWDPMKAPCPPGRSTAFPGATTRVIVPDTHDATKSEAANSSTTSFEEDRRPSLGYDDFPMTNTSDPVQTPTQSSNRPPVGLLQSPERSHHAYAATMPCESPKTIHIHKRGGDRMSLGPTMFREGCLMQTPCLEYLQPGTAAENAATRASQPGKRELDEAALIKMASWSSPELSSTTNWAAKLQVTSRQGIGPLEQQLEKVQSAIHSTSEVMAGPSNMRSRPSNSLKADHSVWASALNNVAPKGAARDRSPSPDPAMLPEGSAPPRSVLSTPQTSPTSDTDVTERPGPTPVQVLEPLDGTLTVNIPPAWQSAPEGLPNSIHGSIAEGSKDLDQEAFLVSHTEEGTTVCGLRRAARRSSLFRPDEPTPLSRPTGIHSNSWSSESGQSINLASANPAHSVFPLAPISSIPTLAPSPTFDATVEQASRDGSYSSAQSPTLGEMVSHAQSLSRTPDLTMQEAATGAVRFPHSPTTFPYGDGNPASRSSVFVSPSQVSSLGRKTTGNVGNSFLAAGKQAENFFRASGYLLAVNPPNEAERQRALARYGPPKISGDPNFDRIGHLVRLVFGAKIVLISLVGADSQLFQTAVGGGAEFSQATLQRIAGSRQCSFCAHAVLQTSDEPLVILDTLKDWRFAGNPLVLGPPHIRFYAGCPLRTPDGHNLGTLCILDLEPHTEFSPRLRHTLKEFGRVVMRELELTRDRIHLTIRDRMQRSIELFTRDCLEMAAEADTVAPTNGRTGNDHTGSSHSIQSNSSTANGGLHALYSFAARNMHETLKLAGAIVFDLSHFELIESPGTTDEDGLPSNSKIFYPSPFSAPDVTPYANFDNPSKIQMINSPHGLPDEAIKSKAVAPMGILGVSESLPKPEGRDKPVPLAHHIKIAQFLRNHRTGYFYPIIPSLFRHLLPTGTSNMLLVPIFGLNKQPFALLCAYAAPSADELLLEDVKDSALQYMRSMGTIILSTVLKKDLMLADQAKSHFISNISHELRTPLHGILASAELLAETKLNTTQGNYLDTVEACGKSLLELVNHVLDFTKLSGSAMSKGSGSHTLTPCDLVKLVQEVCESSWIGQTAKKLDSHKFAGIGSAYASGASGLSSVSSFEEKAGAESSALKKKFKTGNVETIIDVSMRRSGWLVNCDAGGIRRVLMNIVGNSLKFTSSGFVHVSLREVQSNSTHVVVELSVTDTGRGISKSFLEQQLFHPFTQENELGPGTGLGLSIVNSIVQSPSINGKIDVWSTLGEGTEMRITCEMALASASDVEGAVYQPVIDVDKFHTVSLAGFDDSRGQVDLKQVLLNYLEHWWHFTPPQDDCRNAEGFDGDIVVINEDVELLETVQKRRNPLPPVIILSSALGDSAIPEACEAYHAAGGVARMLFKPAGPAKFEAVVDFCLQCLERTARGEPLESEQTDPSTPLPSPRPSPMYQASMENSGDYFESHVLGRDIGADADAAAKKIKVFDAEDSVTPTGFKGDSTTPRALGSLHRSLPGRPPLAPLSRESHHISPALWESTPANLLRRHSDEEEIVRHCKESNVLARQKANLSSSSDSVVVVSGVAPGTMAISKAKAASRPLLPARSITFHQEPKLHKHMALSPSLLRESLTAGGEDYFSAKSLGSAAHVPGPDGVLNSEGKSADSDASKASKTSFLPGSTVTIDGGGDDRLLCSALGTVKEGSKKRLRVMGVDDNEINIKILAAFLAKFNVDFVAARNGQECVDLFEKGFSSASLSPSSFSSSVSSFSFSSAMVGPSAGAFDIIILDLAMPILDGHQATAVIRRKEAERAKASNIAWREMPRVKIVCLTGHNSEEDRRKAFASGADGFLTRPLSLRSLSALMRLLTQ